MNSTKNDPKVLGLQVYAAIMDEANFMGPPLLPANTPVRHRDRPDVVGVIRSSSWIDGEAWYTVEWLAEGFAPQVRKDWIRELPSAMHLLGAV
jgi:hypothetical protein